MSISSTSTPFLGEEALLLRDEQWPEANPDVIADPQRLGLGHLAGRPPSPGGR